jgi:hypothetical protein
LTRSFEQGIERGGRFFPQHDMEGVSDVACLDEFGEGFLDRRDGDRFSPVLISAES